MEQDVIKVQRAMWAFWIAAALAAIGAVAPLSFSIGAHSRLQWVIVPFGIAAVVLGINAVMYHQGRSLAATLYFVAGLAIVYGILAMVAVPLRLAVVGTCPPAPARCPLGYEQPMTSAENSGLALASFCGVLAIFIGFYGLLMLYRRLGVGARPRRGLLWPAKPPSPPVAATPPVTPTPVAAAQAVTPAVEAAPVEATPVAEAPPPPPPSPVPKATAPRVARSRPRSQARAKLQVTDEPKELPAPVEPKELPAP